MVAQNYSRLVIDCNRDPKVATSIPTVSESTEIPGNIDLSEAATAGAPGRIFDPYHARMQRSWTSGQRRGDPRSSWHSTA